MNKITINGREIYHLSYTDQTNATNAMLRTAKPSRLILGDDSTFWLVTPADAERLHRAGYEYAE
jgi:hypothetical protein